MRNLPHGFDIYLVNVKTMRKIAQIFVAFSEKLNFSCLSSTCFFLCDIFNSFSMFSYIYQILNPVFNINFNEIQCQIEIRFKSELWRCLISSLPNNIDLIKISVCFHIPTVYMNRQLQYKLFVWIILEGVSKISRLGKIV